MEKTVSGVLSLRSGKLFCRRTDQPHYGNRRKYPPKSRTADRGMDTLPSWCLPHALDRHPVRQYRLVDAGCRSRVADDISCADTGHGIPRTGRHQHPVFPAGHPGRCHGRHRRPSSLPDRNANLDGGMCGIARHSDTDRRHRFPAVVAVHLLSGRRHRHDDAGLGRHHSGTRPP